MNATDVTGYAYLAAIHCIECTCAAALANQFTRACPLSVHSDDNGITTDMRDREGNPITPIFCESGQCDTCGQPYGE